MKLEIGSGGSPTPGYTHLDIEPGDDIEIVAEARTTGLDDNSADEVYARHMLEHLSCGGAYQALTEWMRTLQQGGRIRIIVPDLQFHLRQLAMPGLSPFFPPEKNISNRTHAMSSIYGWGQDRMAHRWGYTAKTLEEVLTEMGFERVARLPSRECDIDMEAFKP